MAQNRSRLNYLKRCKNVINIVNEHYIEGCTTYAGIFRTHIEPLYPMHYNTFMKIVNMPNVDSQLRKEQKRVAENSAEDSNQQTLFS